MNDCIVSSFIPFERHELEGSIIERFQRIVKRCADKPAIRTITQSFTYQELDTQSDGVAEAILTQRGHRQEPVALLFEHGAASIIGILAVLKAGKFYLALEPSYPRHKLLNILESIHTDLLLTNTQNCELARELTEKSAQAINIDELKFCDGNDYVTPAISPDLLAAVFYTSGSTGEAKGVEWSHRNVLHYAWSNLHEHQIHSDDHYSLVYSYSFAVSVSAIFSTLLYGATLYPYNVQAVELGQFVNWLIQEDITLFQPSISLFRKLLSILNGTENFSKLRFIILGGEPIYAHDVEQFRRYFPPECMLFYRLALTEAGKIAQFLIDHHTAILEHIVPVGSATTDKELLLFDETGQEVKPHEVGEIAVKSKYLSPGYWNDPELTRQKFLPDPEGGGKRIYLTGDLGRMRPDGCLEYLDRKDFMVKIRGYRVVLTEIEAALYALETVKDAVVVAKERTEGEKILVAYVVPAVTPAPTVSDLRRTLAATLPDYMLPSFFVFLDALPLTPTGKADRQALPEPDYARPELTNQFVAPRTPDEIRLAEIWAQTLGLDRVGIHDNFFELGGNSLLAGNVLADINQAFGVDMPMSVLFQAPTIDQLAGRLRQPPVSSAWYSVIPIQPYGTRPPLFFIYPLGRVVHYSVQGTHQLAAHLGTDQPLYGIHYNIAQARHLDEMPLPPRTIAAIAQHYLTEIQQIQPQGPYFLIGRSGGGMIAFEMACQLQQVGKRVALLVLLDTFRPRQERLARLSVRQKMTARWQRLWNPHTGLIAKYQNLRYLHQIRQQESPIAFLRFWWRLWRLNYRIRRLRYTPHCYVGDVMFLASAKQHTEAPAYAGWEPWIAGKFEIIIVPGWHGNMMEDPANLAAMAVQLQHCLRKVHTR